VSKALACSVSVQDAVKHYDQAAGEANVKAAADRPVAKAAKGEATYVGMDSCADCHSDAVEFWKKTVHADAWKTLVDRGQQDEYMRDIVGPGHGEDVRKRLGDGPTGHELRKAALDKAGHLLGAGCTR